MSAKEFSHLDDDGRARMVDVSGKNVTRRTATAQARVRLGREIIAMLTDTGGVAKGDVMGTARLAGIMAAKHTADLIPMCHTLPLDHVEVDIKLQEEFLEITASAGCTGRTGVEMEAMTAASVAALTVYDMCKSAAKGIIIEEVRLLEKTGGRSGTWRLDPEATS